MKTKAAVLYELNALLVIEDLEIPALKRGQVLVKVLYSGVCRAQYNEMIGLKGPDRYLPHLLGHEASAMVIEAGPGVKKVKEGDYVALTWIKGNGLDGLSSQYRKGSQIINAGAVTTFSEYAVVSENRMVKLTRTFPADIAAVIGCAVVTGAGIINNTLKVRPAQSVVIFGIGGVGASSVLAAVQKGADPVIAVDVNPSKLGFARELGASHVINASEGHVLSEIQAVCPDGADYAIDASGRKEAMEQAFESLKVNGLAVIAGNLSKDEKIEIHPFELIKGKRIIGTWGGETIPQRDIPRYARAYCAGDLPIQKLITHRFSLLEINRAFETLRKGEAGRILLNIAGP